MRVLPLVNQKGGCGKTTSAVNLAGALAARGHRVLLVDVDPQAHATLGLGVDPEGPSVADVLLERCPIARAVRPISDGLWLLPANGDLVEFEEWSARSLRTEQVLRGTLAQAAGDWDFVLIDCPPRVDGILSLNALCAATTAILIVETGAFALQGALRAFDVLAEASEAHRSSFDVRAVATMYDGRTRIAKELLVALHARFGPILFDTAIRTSVRLQEAAAYGRTIQKHAPRSKAVIDFAALAEEVEQKCAPDLDYAPTSDAQRDREVLEVPQDLGEPARFDPAG